MYFRRYYCVHQIELLLLNNGCVCMFSLLFNFLQQQDLCIVILLLFLTAYGVLEVLFEMQPQYKISVLR